MLYYFKKGKNAIEMQKKKRCVQCVEKVLWLIVSKWFAKTALHGQAQQSKLVAINGDTASKQRHATRETAGTLTVSESQSYW